MALYKQKYATIAVFGLNKELVLSRLKDQVVFYDIKKTETTLTFSVGKKDFKKVCLFLKRKKLKFKVLKKLNATFLFGLILKNVGIILGVLCWVVFYLVFSGNHFAIKIEHTDLTPEQNSQALSALTELISSNKNSTNREYERQILSSLDFVSGATIKKSGLNYLVSLYKRTEPKQATEIKAPYNLKIKEVVVASGQCFVKAGDVVPQGMVLAKEKIENGIVEAPKILLKAEAYVIGTSFFDSAAPVLLKTGKSYSQTTLSVFGINISKKPQIKYKYYEVETKSEYCSLNNFLPIIKTTTIFYEKEFIKKEKSQPNLENLKALAKHDAITQLGEYLGNFSETYTQMQDGKNIIVKCYLKFDYENI